ncbi:adenylosuccinate lyase [Vampirovibrio sp.]|uniref:adenylosuccinate lyase n=1 Tax=Vampirovibrio sp. TaxID=2717857 RepID=UPI003593F19E
MIERYTLPEMSALWTREAIFKTWLKVELAVLETQESMGLVPAGVSADVSAKARFDIARIDEIEAEVRHDVIAFLTSVAESVGENARFVHMGMTSSDLLDTALSLQIQEAGALVQQKLSTLIDTVRAKALAHRDTVMVGRSHGIHGEPITFGLKLLNWMDELQRQQKRLSESLEENRVGQFSGAMGSYSNIDPEVEARVCALLNLKPALTSTQVISRDMHADFFMTLGNLATSIEKFSVEIRALQKTDILEVEEGFAKGQKGSSAMPHKRNPVSSENLTGLARLLRSYITPALENAVLWHERDISHSSVERVIFPDAFILVHYMLNRFNTVMQDLIVHEDNMRANMNRFGGIIFSQRVLLSLIEKGMSREDAYRLTQKNAHAAWNKPQGDFRQNLLADAEVSAQLSAAEIEACFDVADYLRHVPAIYERFGL